MPLDAVTVQLCFVPTLPWASLPACPAPAPALAVADPATLAVKGVHQASSDMGARTSIPRVRQNGPSLRES